MTLGLGLDLDLDLAHCGVVSITACRSTVPLARCAAECMNHGDEQVDEDRDDRHQDAGDADPDRVATETLCALIIALSHT